MPPATPRVRDGLSPLEYVGYALGDTASNLFFQTFNIFLTIYYTDVVGLQPGAIKWMIPIVRLFDAFSEPVMGILADRTNTRWGKFRPYLLWMCVPYGICGYLVFANPPIDTMDGRLAYAYGSYLLMLIVYTAVNVPYSSLLGVLSPSSRTRTVASSFRFVGAFGGAFLVSSFVTPMVKALGGDNRLQGFQYTMAIFAVLSIALFLICFATTKERVTPPRGQSAHAWGEMKELLGNWPWMVLLFAAIFSTTFIVLRSTSTAFYFTYNLADDGKPILFGFMNRFTVFISSNALCQMLGALCLSLIARFSDKRTLAVLLTLATAICYGSFYFLPKDSYALMLAVNGLGSFCMGPTSALVWAMYGDVADYGEWKFRRRSTALVYSASLFALKTGTTVGGLLVPLLLERFGYVANVVQTPASLLGISLAFSVFPAIFALLKAVALWIYPLTQVRVDEVEKELAARRVATNDVNAT